MPLHLDKTAASLTHSKTPVPLISPWPEQMAWVTIGSLVGYRSRLSEQTFHCTGAATEKTPGLRKHKDLSSDWTVLLFTEYDNTLILSSLHMVDDMQMAFYCIELVNEQGELL